MGRISLVFPREKTLKVKMSVKNPRVHHCGAGCHCRPTKLLSSNILLFYKKVTLTG